MAKRKAKSRPKHHRAGTPNPGRRKAKTKRTMRVGQKRTEFNVTSTLNVVWPGLRKWEQAHEKEFKRFFQFETLENSVQGLLRNPECHIMQSIRAVMGKDAITNLAFHIVHESSVDLTFKLEATNTKKKTSLFAFIVAKNHQEFTTVVNAKHRQLLHLHQQAPKYTVRPLELSTLYFPDRHRRKENDRDIAVYMTTWPQGYVPLIRHQSGQYASHEDAVRLLRKDETEQVKMRLVEMLVDSYDPVMRQCAAIPKANDGNLLVKRNKKAPARILFVGADLHRIRMSPAKLVGSIVGSEDDPSQLPLLPAEPIKLVEALNNVLGKDTARTWLSQYVGAAAKHKVPAPHPDYLEKLQERASA